MSKKRYNWKARQVVHTIIDDSPSKRIKLDLNTQGTYDESNQFALPSQKRKTKIKGNGEKAQRFLSAKQRKRLEKIVEKKQKKEKRASLLEALTNVQATPEELQNLTSIASVQTKGLKKYFTEQRSLLTQKATGSPRINSIAGSKREPLAIENKEACPDDPNVVGFDSSGSDESEDDQVTNVSMTNDEPKAETVNKICEIDEEEIAIKNAEVKQSNGEAKKEQFRKPAVFVQVDRTDEIQKARLKLPILAEEQQIMEMINENLITIIAGETGSGKTTQVPQFLYEAGYARTKMIGITEPRRVAAISMARRVAEEMNLSSDQVSYLIRFEGNATENTKIKFMTDGVLLKELKSDFLLTKYSVIILDEAHERSVFTDILIGLLSRVVPLREKKGNPLRLIIMSATPRLQDFTENKRLFKVTPPVLKVDARQFPITIHFNKRTNEDYLREAFKKTIKIHTSLPDGGILVFLPGQRDINWLVRKLRKVFPLRHKDRVLKIDSENKGGDVDDDDDEDDERLQKVLRKRKRKIKIVPMINLDDYGLPGSQEFEESDERLSSDDDDNDEDEAGIMSAQPLWVLPMYSILPSDKQKKVFDPPPTGCRLCVVSTNIAETSLTIPNVKYVVDSGKVKAKLYDKVTGVTSHLITWTSKASADQRAGRSGRTGPGHCYRLYSSAVFTNEFPDFSEPEIQQKPADDLFLQMKCMNISNVINFPFPTAPNLLQLKMAERRLEILGAIKDSKVTPLGHVIANYPVLPRFGKMLALSLQYDLLPYVICLVAALSVQEVLLETPIGEEKATKQKWTATRRQWAGVGNSLLLGDPMVLMKAVGAAEYANLQGNLEKFCLENGLRRKAIIEIRKLRLQLTQEIKVNVKNIDVTVDPKLKPPDDLQTKLLRQLMLASMGDQVAKKIPLEEINAERSDKAKYKYAYRANNMEDPVFLHHSSVLRHSLPEYVVFQEIYETNKMYMRGITAIEQEWLATFVPTLCSLSEPLPEPKPRYDPASGKILCTVTGTFGTQAWPLGNVEMEHPDGVEAYKLFAMFLLEGIVFVKLEKYVKVLLFPPTALTKSWANSQPKIVSLLKALISMRCRTRSAVENIWEGNPQFLLKEYLKWLPESAHAEASLCWPPLNNN